MALLLVISTICVADAAAQAGAPALNATSSGRRQEMTVVLSADEAFDSDPLDSGASVASSRDGGLYSGLQGGVRYKRRHASGSVLLAGDTSLRYYPQLGRVSALSQNLGAQLETGLGRKTQLLIRQNVSRSPFYRVRTFTDSGGDGSMPLAADLRPDATFRWDTTSLASGLELSRAIGRRSTLSLHYSHQRMSSNFGASGTSRAHMTYGYRLTRNATARAGYGQRFADYALLGTTSRARVRSHDLDLGIDYNRRLSLSRRTTVGFRTGSAIVPESGGGRPRLLAEVSAMRHFGRTWSSSVGYARQLQFTDIFIEPLLADTVSIDTGGSLSRRLSVSISAAASRGTVGFAEGDRAHLTYRVTASSRWALSRHVAAYAEYASYRHHLGSGVHMRPGVGRRAERHEGRVGLVAWTSFLH